MKLKSILICTAILSLTACASKMTPEQKIAKEQELAARQTIQDQHATKFCAVVEEAEKQMKLDNVDPLLYSADPKCLFLAKNATLKGYTAPQTPGIQINNWNIGAMLGIAQNLTKISKASTANKVAVPARVIKMSDNAEQLYRDVVRLGVPNKSMEKVSQKRVFKDYVNSYESLRTKHEKVTKKYAIEEEIGKSDQ